MVVSGPSGVGKDTVLRRVFELDPDRLQRLLHHQGAAAGERDGVDYTFVREAEFDRLVAEGELLEWANVHNHRYGTGWQRIEDARGGGRDVALNIDVQGGMSIRAQVPDALLIFIAPANA